MPEIRGEKIGGSRVIKIRKWFSFVLVEAAKRVYPESEYVKQFHVKLISDCLIEGRAIVRISGVWPKESEVGG